MHSLSQLGYVNLQHGVCGFTSTLIALCLHYGKSNEVMQEVLKDGELAILRHIVAFINHLTILGKRDTIREIERFNQSIPDRAGWTVDGFKGAVEALEGWSFMHEISLDVGMPSKALLEYLRVVWRIHAVINEDVKYHPEYRPSAILGVREDTIFENKNNNEWKGLDHYVYRDGGGRIYSWDERYLNLTDLNSKTGHRYEVIFEIRL